jgi:serine/threonine-protein kinase
VAERIGVGSELGGYRITGLIGQGGMGVVYLADDLAGGGQAALKVLSPELAGSADFRRRFARESRYASSLHHPNIIRVHSAGETDGVLFMAMEYAAGTDLKTLLALEGALDAGRAVEILSQVAAALDAAHAKGLLHRDVKPGNIIVAPGSAQAPEHCYLTDFGLSKNSSQESAPLTGAGDFVGTFYYTSPEQVLGKELDPRADVYALGCVLYECLTGEPPFKRELDVDVLEAHVERPPPRVTELRPELPAAVDEVIATAMAKRPSERYATCTQMMESARAAVRRLVRAAPAPVAGAAPPAPPGGGPGKLRLKVTAGNALGSEIEVEDEFLIGRHAPGEGKLEDDIEISRRHARISRTPEGSYVIEDLGSTNGTLVNGRRISAPQTLLVGDTVEVGGTTLVVQFSTLLPPAEHEGGTRAASVQQPEPTAEPVGEGLEAPADPAPLGGAPALPRLSLHLDIDFESGRARLELGEGERQIRLVHQDGRWRVEPEA